MSDRFFPEFERPPLGLRPEFVHEREANVKRISEIMEAMHRYAEDGNPAPEEWFTELRTRVGVKKDLNDLAAWMEQKE